MLFDHVYALLEPNNALEPEAPDETPSTPLVAAMLETMTNKRLIALLRHVRDNPKSLWFGQSVELSRRSDLFDKLIIMKGQKRLGWVLRLHTFNLVSVERKLKEKKAMGTPSVVKSGVRSSNLGR